MCSWVSGIFQRTSINIIKGHLFALMDAFLRDAKAKQAYAH